MAKPILQVILYVLIATILAVCLIPVLFVAVSRIAGSKAGAAPPETAEATTHGGGH